MLTANQDAFCKFVAAGHTQVDAFVRAGYSEKGARENSSKLIKRPHIQERIRALKETISSGGDIEIPIMPVVEPPTEDFSATDFTKPSIAWLRKEIYMNMIEARDNGNYKEANDAAALLFKTMFSSEAPKLKGGRPRKEKPEDQEETDDNAKRTINVSIFNQVAQRLDREGGNESAGEVVDATPVTITPERHLPDLRPGSAEFSFDESSGDVREGVPRETEGECS